MYDPLTWLPGSFFRSPAWRWQRAEYLASTGRRLDRRVDDDWVDHARTVLRGVGGRGSPAAAVHVARDLWMADGPARWELEARLLTPEPVARVAERAGLSAAVVEAFETVFFDVRTWPRATDWRLARAVGYSAAGGFTSRLPGAAWRLAAHLGGPVVLDVVMAATTGGPLPAGLLAPLRGPSRVAASERLRRRARLWVTAMGAVSAAEVAAVVRERRRLGTLFPRAGRRGASDAMGVACERLLLVAARPRSGGDPSDVGLAGATALPRAAIRGGQAIEQLTLARQDSPRDHGSTRAGQGTPRKVG